MDSSSAIQALRTHAVACIQCVVVGTLLCACLYDKDDRCRDRRIYEDGYCICPADTTEKGLECVAEVAAPSGLGDACAQDDPCTSDKFSRCVMGSDSMGYCTSEDCTSDTDCGGEFSCSNASEDDRTKICKRLPTGIGSDCTTGGGECDEFEASYCLALPTPGATGTCSVTMPSCSADSCPSAFSCIDLSMFAPGAPIVCGKSPL